MSAYGYCPTCGAPGVWRSRTINGNDRCERGHTYASASARKGFQSGRDLANAVLAEQDLRRRVCRIEDGLFQLQGIGEYSKIPPYEFAVDRVRNWREIVEWTNQLLTKPWITPLHLEVFLALADGVVRRAATSQIAQERQKLTRDELQAECVKAMCDDPSALSEADYHDREQWLNGNARTHGFTDWIAAYHELSAPQNGDPT